MLFELASLLREKLLMYGEARNIEIQSYMWVVAYRISEAQAIENAPKQVRAFTGQPQCDHPTKGVSGHVGGCEFKTFDECRQVSDVVCNA